MKPRDITTETWTIDNCQFNATDNLSIFIGASSGETNLGIYVPSETDMGLQVSISFPNEMIAKILDWIGSIKPFDYEYSGLRREFKNENTSLGVGNWILFVGSTIFDGDQYVKCHPNVTIRDDLKGGNVFLVASLVEMKKLSAWYDAEL